jgi:NAD-dependent deacetylase
MIEYVIPYVETADKLLVIGTSLAVYPAAGLIDYANINAEKYYIDPKGLNNLNRNDFTIISKKAVDGVSDLIENFINKIQ